MLHRRPSASLLDGAALMLRTIQLAAVLVLCSVQIGSATDASVKYTGVNIAGGDFAPQSLPGRYGTDYIYPDHKTIDYFAAKGMNIIRVPALWERLQHQLGGDLDSAEMRRLDDVVDYAASKGMRVILDVHNYAAYRGAMIGTESVPANALGGLWGRIAQRYKDNDAVIFGLMNEPNNLPTETWLQAANGAIAEIRKTGAKNLILVPGVGWSSARSWGGGGYGTPNSEAMLKVEDPADNFAYEVHQYFNADWTGASPDCQSVDVGVASLSPVTEWAKQHGKRAFLGEVGVGSGSTCLDALDRVMAYMSENSEVWLGWTYWAGGAWWPKDYFTNLQPLDGKDRPQMGVLKKYTQADATMR
jgi:endoglucanase